MDVLVPRIGEIIGGSQREERYDVLVERIKARGHERRGLLRGTSSCASTAPRRTPASASGFERLVLFVTGMANIRDVIPFPRTPGHAEF